jgi:hypothetical protein
VKCTHGATVGPLDEEKVFYIRSRESTSLPPGVARLRLRRRYLRRFDLPGSGGPSEKLLAWLPDAAGSGVSR